MSEKLTKDKIIEAVLNSSFYRSTGATSLTDIANELHIKKASLYNHFNNRDDLLAQTTASCAEYIRAITFIPADVDAIAKKYSPETVLKGIVNRYFKMHEKSPLFQIYTYVESQKYFNAEAAAIVKEEKEKIVKQTEQVLLALAEQGKLVLTKSSAQYASQWFCSGVNDLLNLYLVDRKQIIVKNPATGEGELFTIPADEHAFDAVDLFVEQFVTFIK